MIPSNVYTYEGFLPSLLYCSNHGMDGDHFYLGGADNIQLGLVNLALFLANAVANTVVYESCDPDKLACGIWAMDTMFEDDTRFICSGGSKTVECLDANIWCACILGLLDHHVGSKSIPGSTPYSDVQFCSTDPYESVCSGYLEKGEESRWLTSMTYWVTFVQRYQSRQPELTQTYMSGLESFVNDGMQDSSFIEYVADIRIHESIKKAPIENFLDAYYKIIDLLLSQLDGLPPEEQQPIPSEQPTDSPLAPPTVTISLSEKPTNRPEEPLTNVPLSELKTSKPVGAVNKPSSVQCPLLCVVPIKTTECPPPSRKLKQCFKNFIGLDELCIAAYGECDTSEHSVNDCGSSYNVFRRIDCSILSDYPHLERENASDFSSIAPSSSRPVSLSPSHNFEYDVDDYPMPTTKPTYGFGGIVWWENANSSSSDRICPMPIYTTILFIAVFSIVLQS